MDECVCVCNAEDWSPLGISMLRLYVSELYISGQLQYSLPPCYNISVKYIITGEDIDLRTWSYDTRILLDGLLLGLLVTNLLQTTPTWTICFRSHRRFQWKTYLFLPMMWGYEQNRRLVATFCCSCWITPVTSTLGVHASHFQEYWKWMLVLMKLLRLRVSCTCFVRTATTWRKIQQCAGFQV